MPRAISVENANLRLKDVTITGFDTGISAKHSNLHMSGMKFSDNRVALDLERTPATIITSRFNNNQIDIIADNTPLIVIDSILANIINRVENMAEVNIHTNPFKVGAKAKDAIKTKEDISKRKKFKEVLKMIAEYAGYAATFYGLFELVVRMSGLGG